MSGYGELAAIAVLVLIWRARGRGRFRFKLFCWLFPEIAKEYVRLAWKEVRQADAMARPLVTRMKSGNVIAFLNCGHEVVGGITQERRRFWFARASAPEQPLAIFHPQDTIHLRTLIGTLLDIIPKVADSERKIFDA